MKEVLRILKRFARVFVAGGLAAVVLSWSNVTLWWALPFTAAIEAAWKGLRGKYPNYWLWKLM